MKFIKGNVRLCCERSFNTPSLRKHGTGKGARNYIILSVQCFGCEGDGGGWWNGGQVSLPRAGHSWAALAGGGQQLGHRRRLWGWVSLLRRGSGLLLCDALTQVFRSHVIWWKCTWFMPSSFLFFLSTGKTPHRQTKILVKMLKPHCLRNYIWL